MAPAKKRETMRFEIQTNKDIRGPLPYKKGLKIGFALFEFRR